MININFTADAWKKQMSLIRHFNTEVAWHGLVRPIKGGYEIYDILVYPQKVTGGTVETDQVEYQNWLMQQPDEVFNHIRYQGHSHVNMDTHPSGVDLENQRRMNVPKDDFYIFFIWNKDWWYTAVIYDHGKMLNQYDVNLTWDQEEDCQEFIKQAEGMLTEIKPVYPKGAKYPKWYDYYGGSYYSGSWYSQFVKSKKNEGKKKKEKVNAK